MVTYLLTLSLLVVDPIPPRTMSEELKPPVRLQADGKPIDVDIGHAAPYFADIDGDGLKDLLVGQFGGGKLRVYKNVGSKGQPKFAGFTYLQAGGQDASVPSG